MLPLGIDSVNMSVDAVVDQPLKILMVIDTFENSKNGAVISTQRFTKLLREQHQVTVLTTGTPGPDKVILPEFYPPFFERVMRRMKTPLAVPFGGLLKNAISGKDIVHVQFPFYLGVRAIFYARRAHTPVVSTFHIQAEHLAMNAGIKSKQFIQQTYRYWINYIYNRSDMVICPSKFAQEELKKYGLTAPAMVISNGILPVFRPLPVSNNGSFHDKFVLLSVGRYAPEKGHSLIISAVDKSRYRDKIQLILIGDGPLRERLQIQGNTLPNPPVFLTLDSEDLVEYYNLADLYVHAACVEVECMSVLEAIACGLPPLIADSDKSATRQFALSEQALFECDNCESLIREIEYWIEHPNELKKAKLAYQEESLKYRIEVSLQKLTKVYQELHRSYST